MEDMGGFVECFDPATNRCVVTPVCGLRRVLARGIEAFTTQLNDFTVAHLIGDPKLFRTAFDRTS